MRLNSLTYSEFQDTPRAWSISGLTLESTNLVVGKNATGKTRTLNVLKGLGNILSGRQKPSDYTTGHYDISFEHENRALKYEIKIDNNQVIYEYFEDASKPLLERKAGGIGEIFHEKEGRNLAFQAPVTEAAVVARRDTIQHSFLEPLAAWGSGVRHYAFGEMMGRTSIGILIEGGPQPDPSDPNQVVGLFHKGLKYHSDQFKNSIMTDMNEIGYEIEDIGLMPPTDFQISMNFPLPGTPVLLYVKERKLADVTQQMMMSQGMFRALSVIIHLQYAIAADHPSCILIDDIGEGLDFDRSCRLIDVIRRRAQGSSIQLVLSTNDRFIMNNVPLEEWSLLDRDGSSVQVHNYKNARQKFDDFKFMGLNNFDFLAMDFIHDDPSEAESQRDD